MNKSLLTGVVARMMKIAMVTPIYKVRDYRPISLLPSISNILEMVFYHRL